MKILLALFLTFFICQAQNKSISPNEIYFFTGPCPLDYNGLYQIWTLKCFNQHFLYNWPLDLPDRAKFVPLLKGVGFFVEGIMEKRISIQSDGISCICSALLNQIVTVYNESLDNKLNESSCFLNDDFFALQEPLDVLNEILRLNNELSIILNADADSDNKEKVYQNLVENLIDFQKRTGKFSEQVWIRVRESLLVLKERFGEIKVEKLLLNVEEAIQKIE